MHSIDSFGVSRSSGKHIWFCSIAIDWSLENNCWRRDDSQCSSTGGEYWNTIPYLGDGALPLWTFMLKTYGDSIQPDDKRYFNYRNSRARLVTEGTLGRLKIKFKVLFRKCESNKETLKLYGLACVLLHNLCIERGDLVPRKFDLTPDHALNLSPGEVMGDGCFGIRKHESKKLWSKQKIWSISSSKSINC